MTDVRKPKVLTPEEEHVAYLRGGWNNPASRAKFVADYVAALAQIVADDSADADVRERSIAALEAMWLAASTVGGQGKEAKRLLLAAAVQEAAGLHEGYTMPMRVEEVRAVFGNFFPDDAADLRPAHLESAITSWHGRRGRRSKDAPKPVKRWEAMVDLYRDISCDIEPSTAENEWSTRQR